MCSMTSIIPLPVLQTGSITQPSQIQPELCCNTTNARRSNAVGYWVTVFALCCGLTCHFSLLWNSAKPHSDWMSDHTEVTGFTLRRQTFYILHYISLKVIRDKHLTDFLLTSGCISSFDWIYRLMDWGKEGGWIRFTIWTGNLIFAVQFHSVQAKSDKNVHSFTFFKVKIIHRWELAQSVRSRHIDRVG